MPKVIYKGYGNAGGSVAVDNTNYAAKGSFTVAGPASLTPGSSPFFYWNTKADATGLPLLDPDVPELRRWTLED